MPSFSRRALFVGAVCTVATPRVSLGQQITREFVEDDREYFVDPSGSDSNTGISQRAPFRTWQRFLDLVSTLDTNRKTIALTAQPGIYTDQCIFRDVVGGGRIVLQGKPGERDNTIIRVTGKDAFYPDRQGVRGLFELRGCKSETISAGIHIVGENAGFELWLYDWNFGASPQGHLCILNHGLCRIRGDYVITGDAKWHWQANHIAKLQASNLTITIHNTPDFESSFAIAERNSLVTCWNNVYKGSATGRRYNVNRNATIDADGATLPGSMYGTASSGGIFA